MIPAAELKVRVAIEGIPQGNAQLTAFEGNLKRVSGYDASATLQANVEGRGFEEFDARLDAVRARTARPITQEVRADVDQNSFTATVADIAALKHAVDRQTGGMKDAVSGALAPWGMWPTALAAVSPPLLQLTGAAGALAGSLGEAALGAGALAVGGFGTGSVGLAGVVGVAVPAVKSLVDLRKAQGAYNEAVLTYGRNSTQAETALKKVTAAEKMAGPQAARVSTELSHIGHEWMALTKPGRSDFLGALGDGLDQLDRKLPLLSDSANRSTSAMRRDFASLLSEITGHGSGFDQFINRMTANLVESGPDVSHALADWVRLFERIGIAVSPDLIHGLDSFSSWSDDLLASTDNARELRRDVHGLVEQTSDWLHLLGAGGDVLITLFGEGAGEGQTLVEDMTGKFEDWTRWIEGNRGEVRGFFRDAGEGIEHLLGTAAGLAQQWFVVAQAMEPVEAIVLDVTEALNSIKIGDFSALTLLITGSFVASSAGKALAIFEVVRGYKALQAALAAQAASTTAVAASEGEAAAAANAQTSANVRLAASIQGVAAANRELLIANASGAVTGSVIPGAGAAAGSRAAAGPAARGAIGEFGERRLLEEAGLIGGGAAAGAGASAAAEAAAAEAVSEGRLARLLGSPFAKAGAVAGGYFAAEFGTKAIEDITGKDFLENQNLLEALTHGFSTSKQGKALTEEEGNRKAFDLNPKLDGEKRVALERAFEGMMVDLSVSASAGMGEVNKNLSKGLAVSNTIWAQGTPTWRKHTAEAMEKAVHAIRTGMQLGTIPVEQGQREINRLLGQIHLTRGDDPFGLAEATAKSFKQANAITASGVNDWTHKLDKMPKAAREKTIDATMGMLDAWADGHPKIERQIDALTLYQIRKFGATNKQLREGVRRDATGPVAEAFREAALGVGGALENIGTNTNQMLKLLNLDGIGEFQALVFGPSRMPQNRGQAAAEARHHPTFHQDGGIVPGVTDGDSVHRHVRPRSFILNREATRYFGFNEGGMVPVVLEPGEREFTPEQVDRIGLDTLMWMNAAVPRFQDGGEVDVKGPGVLAGIGHGALKMATEGVNRYFEAHRPKVAPGGPGGPAPPGFDGLYRIWQPNHPQWDVWQAGLLLQKMGFEVAENPHFGGVHPVHTSDSYHYLGRAIDFNWPGGGSAELGHLQAVQPGLARLHPKDPLIEDAGGSNQHGHFAFQRGGQAGGHDRKQGAFGHNFQSRIHKIWGEASSFFPPGATMPRTWATGANGHRAHTSHFEDGSIAVYLGRDMAQEVLEELPFGEETLIHEWAHAFQPEVNKRLKSGRSWEVEGGAEAFAHWAAPQIYGDLGYYYENPPLGYPGRTAKAIKEKGWDWVKHGQFALPAGTDDGAQLGGQILALQHGGEVRHRSGGGAPDSWEEYVARTRHVADRAWGALGRSRAPKPAISVDDSATFATDIHSRRIHIPSRLGGALFGHKRDRFSDHAKRALVHEFAHAMQRDAVIDSIPEREGGASWFADIEAPGVWAELGFPYANGAPSYPGYRKRVEREHDRRWAMHGQLQGYQRGGPVLALQSGGFVGNINHVFPEHNSAAGDWGGETLPSFLVAALAESAGDALGVDVPGRTMEQVTRGESGAGRKGSARPGATGVDPGGTKGLGLWMITTNFNDALIAKYGGQAAMRNPVPNAAAMVEIYANQGLGAWYGDGSVTGSDLHYTGDYDIRNALGGATFKEALEGKAPSGGQASKPVPETVDGHYTKHPAGSTSAGGGTYGEDVQGRYHVQTEQLDFGPLPDSVKACTKELNLRRRQVGEYRAAASQTKRLETRRALGANVSALERRIGALRAQRDRLLQRERLKKAVRKINEAAEFKAWTAPGGIFEKREAAFNELGERAEQKVSLEPESQAASADWVNSVLKPYVDGIESPAYQEVLSAAGEWRNAILGAEGFAHDKLDSWHTQIETLKKNIEAIQGLKGDHPQAWEKRKGELPGMRQKIKALHAAIGQTRDTTLPEWESALGGVQGLGRSHTPLPSLPGEPSEMFGGNIFSTQMTIRELGLKVPSALAGVSEDGRTEQLELELELERQANRRYLVEGALAPVLKQYESSYPLPWMGAFAEGGVALVGERGPEIAHFPSGTRVHTAADTERMLANPGQFRVIINGSIRQEVGDTRDPIEVLRGNRRFDALVEEKVNQFRGSLPTPGGQSWRP